MFDWKDIVKTVAPIIGTSLGGPLGGTGMKFLLDAVGLGEGATEDQVKKAVENASPETLAKLKEMDNTFKLKMTELGISEKQLAYQDTDSARKREMSVGDKTPAILAYSLTFGFFTLLGTMLFYDVPASNRDLLNIMVGVFGAAFTGVVTYYFGSSAGSAKKTLIMNGK